MANLTEVAQFDAGVYQLETTDPVQGGANGVSNAPLKNLTNRTAYLKKHIDDLESGAFIPSAVATLGSPAFTGTPTAPTQSLGNNTTRLATTAFVQGTVGGRLAKSVAGGVNVTLTAVEAGNAILEFTGALTANIAVIVPSSPTRSWVVKNGTSGAFTLTVKTAAGSGVVVTQGKTEAVYTDGTNVLACHDDYTDISMTGTPTAPTAAVGTNTTQLATTAFVATAVGNVSVFASGTKLMFAQASAPTGWTQDTTDSAANRMLRVVNTAGGGVGGSHSPILNNVVPAHTHGFTTGNVSNDHYHSGTTQGVSNNHTHGITLPTLSNSGSNFGADGQEVAFGGPGGKILTTWESGQNHTHWFQTGGISSNHTHSGSTDNGSSQTNWTPRYIDMILCSKN